eukprot:m.907077 g.907077  ORF g.907077 m.907077 type:complete len:605 (+) comp60085_c0_seq7:3-1817(+)
MVPIPGDRREEVVRGALDRSINGLLVQRNSKFLSPRAISLSTAQGYLATGRKLRSAFNLWDPVDLLKGKAVQPTATLRYPVLLREFVYFFGSEDNRKEFLLDCEKFLQKSPPPPMTPVRLALVGPPKSGKTSVAKYLEQKLGCQRISVGSALRLVLDSYPYLHLTRQIMDHLVSGGRVPDELAMEAVAFAVSLPQAQTCGYVLDGVPSTVHQAKLLTEKYVIPVEIVELGLSCATSVKRFLTESAKGLDYVDAFSTPDVIELRYQAYSEAIAQAKTFMTEMHQNWKELQVETFSRFKANDTVLEIARQSLRRQQGYLDALVHGKAAPIFGLCVTAQEAAVRLGPFGLYCPVSWFEKRTLIKTDLRNFTFAVEFGGKYFYLANQAAFDAFMSAPKRYAESPPPANYPTQRVGADARLSFPLQYAFQGYCPVTYVLGHAAYESIQPGSTDFVAEYDGKIFCFASQRCLDQFMAQPHKFADVPLPKKLPPRVEPLSVLQLPMLGFMEQTCSTAITEAMTAVGLQRPKYPFLTATQSAQLFFALTLKANDPKSNEYKRTLYRLQLRAFVQGCERLSLLTSHSLSDQQSVHTHMTAFFALSDSPNGLSL